MTYGQTDVRTDIAATLHRDKGDAIRFASNEVFADIPADEPAGGDKEEHIDALIDRAKALLGEINENLIVELYSK